MRFKWMQNKLTFLIIPEANASVVRVNLSRGAVCGLVLCTLLLLGASYVQVAHQLQQDLTNKNNTIEKLQNEVFQLSRQADEVRSKIEEVKALEHDINKLSSFIGTPTIEIPATATVLESGGMGGPPSPVTTGEMQLLTSAAFDSYTELQQELNVLKARFVQSKQYLLIKRDQIEHLPSLWPTRSRTVTSPFGYRKDPFTEKLSFHRGIDIAGKLNDPVHASANGVAITVGYDQFHGHHIVLEHKNGYRTWYMHLNRASVQQGEQVERGQQIGHLGSSGRSTGPHLHYEILHNGKSTNPLPYLPSP